jgi:UDP-N-acetyl-2-amino-2-deoxyglucuronate dehydrogenase
MTKIGFAVIGCGAIGKRHIAVVDSEESAELVAVCDIDEKKGSQLSNDYGVKFYKDYQEILALPEVDIVSIATPHGLHCEMTIAAAKAGKNILVEKPMALTINDCNLMIAAAKENNVKLFVVKQNRFNTPIALTKKALDEKKLGKIFMFQSNILWNRNQEYYDNSEWRGTKKLEGGALYTQVSHFLDLLIWWFGEPVEAETITDTKNHDIEIEDCGVSVIRFKNGAIGSLNWTTCVYNKNLEGSITIIGEKGTIKIGGQYLNKIEFWDVQSYPLPEGIVFEDKPNNYGKYQGTSSNHDKVVDNVVKKLLNERSNVVEGDEGLLSISMIEHLYNHDLGS